MLVVTNFAMIGNERIFIGQKKWLLAGVGAGIFALAVWMTVEAVIAFFGTRQTTDIKGAATSAS